MMFWSIIGLGLAETSSPLVEAVQIEINRGMAELQLDTQPKPYWMEANIIDASYTMAQAMVYCFSNVKTILEGYGWMYVLDQSILTTATWTRTLEAWK